MIPTVSGLKLIILLASRFINPTGNSVSLRCSFTSAHNKKEQLTLVSTLLLYHVTRGDVMVPPRSTGCLEAVVGAGQHGLGALEPIDLLGAGFLALLEVRHDEVALPVQLLHVRLQLRERLVLEGLAALGLLQVVLQVSLGLGLGGLGLDLLGLRGLRVRGELLVVLLGLLLLVLGLHDLDLELF